MKSSENVDIKATCMYIIYFLLRNLYYTLIIYVDYASNFKKPDVKNNTCGALLP